MQQLFDFEWTVLQLFLLHQLVQLLEFKVSVYRCLAAILVLGELLEFGFLSLLFACLGCGGSLGLLRHLCLSHWVLILLQGPLFEMVAQQCKFQRRQETFESSKVESKHSSWYLVSVLNQLLNQHFQLALARNFFHFLDYLRLIALWVCRFIHYYRSVYLFIG